MTNFTIIVLALVLGVAVAHPQNFGSFGGGNFGGGFGGNQEVETFQSLPAGGYIEDDQTIR